MALTDGLSHYWTMDEGRGQTRVDSVGDQDLPETFNGVGSTTGIIGDCGHWTDTIPDNYLEAVPTPDTTLPPGHADWTVSVWLRLYAKALHMGAIGNTTLQLGERAFVLEYHNASDRFRFRLSGDGTNETILSATSFGSPSLDTWYHVVATHDATNDLMGVTVNAGTRDTAAHSAGLHQAGSGIAFRMFSIAPVFLQRWRGMIDEGGVWTRVLSEAEVAQLYNGGAGLEYPFSSGAEASGLSPRGRDCRRVYRYEGTVVIR